MQTPAKMLLVPLIAYTTLAACETESETKYVPPTLTQSQGIVPFKIVQDDLSVDKERSEVRLALTQPAEREQIDALLKDVYRQIMTRIGIEPSAVEIYAYGAENVAKTFPDRWLAKCIKHAEQKGPTFENKVPLTFPKAVRAAIGKDTFLGKLQPKIEIDEEAKRVSLTVPYVEPGKETWAEQLSYNTAVLTFVDYAQRLYQNVPEIDGFSFTGIWKDQPVVRIALASKADYNTLDLYALGERIGGKQGQAFAAAQLTKKSDAVLDKEKKAAERKEYQAALGKLPKGQVTISGSLK